MKFSFSDTVKTSENTFYKVIAKVAESRKVYSRLNNYENYSMVKYYVKGSDDHMIFVGSIYIARDDGHLTHRIYKRVTDFGVDIALVE